MAFTFMNTKRKYMYIDISYEDLNDKVLMTSLLGYQLPHFSPDEDIGEDEDFLPKLVITREDGIYFLQVEEDSSGTLVHFSKAIKKSDVPNIFSKVGEHYTWYDICGTKLTKMFYNDVE